MKDIKLTKNKINSIPEIAMLWTCPHIVTSPPQVCFGPNKALLC